MGRWFNAIFVLLYDVCFNNGVECDVVWFVEILCSGVCMVWIFVVSGLMGFVEKPSLIFEVVGILF